jgi:endo-1,4-beta-xylanase
VNTGHEGLERTKDFTSFTCGLAITWWNMVDGGAAQGEPSFSGLYDREMNPKPAYDALDRLINHEWKTRLTVKAEAGKPVAFRGFKGRYRVTYTDASGTADCALPGSG